ncbi:MAG: hypothetical protein GC179_30800 [Anaerolineaceae bacterium]|nr:hypothetical protein [Anaerolineaceae bacterium]
MTDHFLILIPTDPQYVPQPEHAQAANDYLISIFPEADDIVWVWSDTVEFVDPGDNFERVVCPACETELHMSDWQHMMNIAFDNQFSDLNVTMPCCHATGSLNDLHYVWPAGFARFSLEALNPNADLDDQHMRDVEEMLGCGVRKIWRRL